MAAAKTKIIATLVRGKTYSLANPDGSRTNFKKSEPQPVNAAQRERLEATATDWITRLNDDDQAVGVHVQKFRFDEAPA